jgi:hypothetical protein|tara:strand:+ start:75 stop:791 length:717 start_codon:yes stop_codon:yes gene_type:complete
MTLTTINLAALGDTINLSTEVTGTLPTGNGGTGSTATTFVNAASNVTGTLPVPNGGTGLASGTTDQFLKFTGSTTVGSAAVEGGLSGYDRWQMNSSFSGDAEPITANWARTGHGEFAKIGTGMTESSGVFTFPNTGVWEVKFTCQFYGTDNAFGRAQIKWSTNSGGSFTSSGWGDSSSWGQPNGNNGQYQTITSSILNVTNAGTFRVNINAEQQNNSNGNVYGTGADCTFAEFTQLGT